jgi:hypothetical protein
VLCLEVAVAGTSEFDDAFPHFQSPRVRATLNLHNENAQIASVQIVELKSQPSKFPLSTDFEIETRTADMNTDNLGPIYTSLYNPTFYSNSSIIHIYLSRLLQEPFPPTRRLEPNIIEPLIRRIKMTIELLVRDNFRPAHHLPEDEQPHKQDRTKVRAEQAGHDTGGCDVVVVDAVEGVPAVEEDEEEADDGAEDGGKGLVQAGAVPVVLWVVVAFGVGAVVFADFHSRGLLC